jgi:aerobic carbon-monoxide dehydrogenase medium subunit
MIPFELAQPRSLAEAIRLLDPDDETVRPIAGGTALMLMMKAGVFRPAKLVSLRNIERKYADIATTADGLMIGAMTTLADLERSSNVRQHAPIITQTLLTLSNVRVRNVATVGGALAHGDPHMDLPPVLMALGASITVVRPRTRAQPAGGKPVFRILRNRAGEERADRVGVCAGTAVAARGLHEGDYGLR